MFTDVKQYFPASDYNSNSYFSWALSCFSVLIIVIAITWFVRCKRSRFQRSVRNRRLASSLAERREGRRRESKLVFNNNSSINSMNLFAQEKSKLLF